MAVKSTSLPALKRLYEEEKTELGDTVSIRALFRVLPLVFERSDWKGGNIDPRLIIALFRTLLVLSTPASVPNKEALLGARNAAAFASRGVSKSDRENAPFYSRNAARIAHLVSAVLSDAATGAASVVADYAGDRSPVSKWDNPAVEAALTDAFRVIENDCKLLVSGTLPNELMRSRLWPHAPRWWEDSWINANRWLSHSDHDFEIWIEWFLGVLSGHRHVFRDFDDAGDLVFYRWLVRQSDDWWGREPKAVNVKIADFVDSLRGVSPPTDEELRQNPQTFTFSHDANERSELDSDLLPNGLQGDTEERDNHTEILRLIDNAIHATSGDTNAKDMAEPTHLLREAVGETIEGLRPRFFVLRAREVIRQVEERQSGLSMNPQLSEKQRDAYIPLTEALKMVAEFSPKLAELWHGKMGQTGTPLTREMLDLIAEALRNAGQTNALAQEVIEASNRQVSNDAPEDDPARIAASETSRNAIRKMGGKLKSAGDGAKDAENIISLGERVVSIWGSVRGKLPSDEVVARILGYFGGGS